MSETGQGDLPFAGKTALVIDAKDNVGMALTDLEAGDCWTVTQGEGEKCEIGVLENIPFGHKFALTDLDAEAPVYKYGEEIGRMKTAVKRGGWIHTHNMYCDRGMK